MRFEIETRDGLARTGALEIDGVTYRTPTIAFVDTWKHAAPRESLKLRQSSLAKDGDLSIASSAFSGPPENEGSQIEVGFRGSPYADEKREGAYSVPANVSELVLNSKAFAETIDTMKNSALLKPAFLPVAGLPCRLALFVYCGYDLFDSIPLTLAAENDVYLTTDGAIPLDRIDEPPCGCSSCEGGIADRDGLLRHNVSVAESELRLVRHHIKRGTLRELVESRIRAEPWQVQSLRLLDMDHFTLQELHTPIRGSEFRASSKESLNRPDVARWRRRLTDRYTRPPRAKMLVLLPCSARKPYSVSPSHRRFREAIRDSGVGQLVHEVIVTSPLGLVPRELELFYPARDYDIPVTGHWDNDEQEMVRDLVRWLVETQRYDVIISHLGNERDVVSEVIDDCIDTSGGRPGSRESLRELQTVLRDQAPRETETTSWKARTVDDMTSLARFQFGEAGTFLTDGAKAVGRWPEVKVMSSGGQLGMISQQRGMISLTLSGAAVISSKDAYCVDIDDFLPKGNLFAVGVEDATDDIRIGDDVAIRHGKDVRAVGVARMTPAEMCSAERGEAVHVRHRVR